MLIAANVFRRSQHHCQLRNEHSRGQYLKVWWRRYISSWIVNWNEWNLPIHVPPRLYIVKSIHHKILRLKKFIRVKRFFCLWTHCEDSQEEASKPIKPCRYLTSNKNNGSYYRIYHNILLKACSVATNHNSCPVLLPVTKTHVHATCY